jgi:hypothetical protein
MTQVGIGGAETGNTPGVLFFPSQGQAASSKF